VRRRRIQLDPQLPLRLSIQSPPDFSRRGVGKPRLLSLRFILSFCGIR
jgi:hypothetical protein